MQNVEGAGAIKKRAYSLQEIAEETGLSVMYLRNCIKDKTLPSVRFGRAIRILAEDYEAFLKGGRKEPETPSTGYVAELEAVEKEIAYLNVSIQRHEQEFAKCVGPLRLRRAKLHDGKRELLEAIANRQVEAEQPDEDEYIFDIDSAMKLELD